MIAFTTLALLVVALLSSIKVSIKRDRQLSFFAFTLLCGVFLQFWTALLSGNEEIFSFLWNSSPGGDIKIDIISNKYYYNLIFPFFVMTLLAIAQNLIFRYEERRSTYSAVLIFNLLSLILMITSNNFVQLLCALFITDILAMFLIVDSKAYRRYILLNMAADMFIFMVLAIINCRVDSLDIREILRYKQLGLHLDFITITGLTAVFMKMGFWGFHVGLVGLKDIRLHRLLNVIFLSSPVSAIVLLMKFHVLWNSSPYFAPYLHGACLISIGGGFIGSLIMDNIKHKVIYWQMMFWAILVELLCFAGFIWSVADIYLLLQMNILMWSLYLLYYYSLRQKSVLSMTKSDFSRKTTCCIIFGLLTLMIAAMTSSLTDVYNRGNRYYIWFFAATFILSLTTVLRQIFYATSDNKYGIIRQKQTHISSILLLTVMSCLILRPLNLLVVPVYGWTAAFVFLCFYSPLWRLKFVYNNKFIQNNDCIGSIYKYVLIKPLRLCGKFLWLLIDHLFIEKIIIEFFLSSAQGVLRFFRRLHNNTTLGGTIIILLLCSLLWFSYTYGGRL